MTTDSPSDAEVVRRASTAVFTVFVVNGWTFASWAARLPAIRDGLNLSPRQMGLLLLLASIGSLIALPMSGLVVQRLGVRRAVVGFSTVALVGLLVASIGIHLGEVPVVGAALIGVGVGIGVWDASMNIEGAAVEQRLGRSVMPRYHAGFSVGTVLAAGVAAGAAALHIPVVVHLPLAAGLGYVLLLISVRSFLPDAAVRAPSGTSAAAAERRQARSAALSSWTEPRTLVIGIVVLAAALAEGSANDWVTLAVVDGFGVTNAIGAIGFALFVAAMTTARMFGTALIDRWGRVRVLRIGSTVALLGVLIFGLVGPLWLALVGVAVWGVGAALGFPIGISAAADSPAQAAARVAVVSTIGYTAFLAGPPVLGLLADHLGYRHALLAVAVPVVIGLLVAGAARPLPEPSEPVDQNVRDDV